MGRRYIKQIINRDFVYPNFEKDEYDDEIIHELNENLVSGSVVTFSATTVSTSSITIEYDFDWDANGAELFQMEDGNYSFVSIHLMDPSQVYMRPYRVIHNIESATEYTGTTSFTGSTTVTPSQLGLSQFTTGVYYYEVRFIGQRAVYVISSSFTVVQASPTPTPSPTVTATVTPSPTPTLTPTPSSYCGTQCRNWSYSSVPVGGDIIHYWRCSDGATQTIAVSEGDSGNFCNCNTSGTPYSDNGSTLTEVGSC